MRAGEGKAPLKLFYQTLFDRPGVKPTFFFANSSMNHLSKHADVVHLKLGLGQNVVLYWRKKVFWY